MALLSNVPTLSYIRWQNLLIIYKDEVYQIYNNHTNKPFIYFDAINSPNELIMSNKKLEERDGLFYIIFNDNGKYIIVPQTEIEMNFSENSSADAVSSKILGFKEQLNEQSQKVTTIETDVEGVKTTVNQFEESITKNETSISTLEQRANEIDAEVEKITIDFNDDIVIRELRENTTMAILSIQSTLGLFSSDMNTYMKDNKLSSAETDEINAYKENLNNELTLMNLQTNNVIDLLEDKGEVEKVTRLNTAIEKLNTAINNLYTNIDTCSVDNVFTNNEIATIISYFGKANVAINELKNLIDECIYLSLGGRLVEEIGKIIVKQDQIQLSVSKNENSIRSTLSKEMSLVQDVVDENIISLNNFRDCLNTISTDGAFTSDEIDVITTRANDLDVNFDEMTSKKSEIEGNTLLSDEQKEEIDKSYTNYKTAHNNLLSNINTITADGLMTTEEMISINEEIENYKNEINNMNTVLFSSLEEINKNGIITDINNVDEKWAEIILDPENGIQSQVGDIQKQINDGGGIIERLNTAEQKITSDAIINTVSSTFYSKEEVDNRLDDIDIGLVVKSIDIMYYLSTSNKTLEGGTWVTEAPSLEDGGYIWSKTVTTYTNETQNETDPICITGGKDGQTLYTWIKYSDNEDGSNMYDTPTDNTLYIGMATNKESETESSNPSDYTWSKFRGVDGNSYYTWIRYADDKDGNGISDNPTDKLYIGFAYNKSSNIESNNPSDYMWSLIKGTDGVNGEKGKDGTTYYTWIKYSDNANGSGMYETPNDKTKYIGIAVNKTTPTESDVASDYKWSKFRGDDGVDGTDGKGILTVVDYYKVYASDIGVTNATSGFSTDVPQMDATNKYLWSYELITYTDNSTTKTNARVIGVYGKNGTDGKGISSIVEYYAVNNSSTTAPTSFGTTIPTISTTNKFLWNYEVINFTDGSKKTTDKRIIGVYGETGKTGKGINNIVEQYYLSTSKTSQTGGSWVDSPPTWVQGKYMWTRSKITYSDNSTVYTTPICDSSWEAVNNLQVGGRNLAILSNIQDYAEGELSNNKYYSVEGTKIIAKNQLLNSSLIGFKVYTDNTFEYVVSGYTDVSSVELYFRCYDKNNTIVQDQRRHSKTVVDGKFILSFNNIPKNTYYFHIGIGNTSKSNYFIDKLKIEKGNKATDYTPAPEDVQTQIDSNTTQITTTKNKVATIETNLNGITQRVSSTETTVSSHTTQLGTVDSRINTAKNSAISTASSDATTKANNALADSKSYTNGQITTVNQTINNKIAEIKATTDSITQRVSSTESTVTTHTTQLGTVDNRINSATTNAINNAVGVKDTRNDNQPPSWYFTNYPKRTVEEFKFANKIGIGTSEVYGVLTTVVPWTDGSGGYPTQTFRSNSTGTYERKGTSDTAWGAWTQVESTSGSQAKATQALNDAKAYTTTQITTTNNKVASIETNLSGITSRVSNVETKQTTANNNISSLTTRMTSAESKITNSAIVNTVTSSTNWAKQTSSISTAQSTATTANATANSALSKANTNSTSISTLTTKLTQTESDFNFKIENVGAENLIKNSDFSAGIEQWEKNGSFTWYIPVNGSEISHNFGKMICIQNSGGGVGIFQRFNTITGQKYTVSFYTEGFQQTPTDTVIGIEGVKTITLNVEPTFKRWSFTFTATSNRHTFVAYLGTGGKFYLGRVMVTQGTVLQEYRKSTSEIYSTNVKIDIDGIEIDSTGANTINKINTNGMIIKDKSDNTDLLKATSSGVVARGGSFYVDDPSNGYTRLWGRDIDINGQRALVGTNSKPQDSLIANKLYINYNGDFKNGTEITGRLTNNSFNVLSDVGSSITQNGYMKLSNGLIIQWGHVMGLEISNGRVVDAHIKYPIDFPNAIITFIPSIDSVDGNNYIASRYNILGKTNNNRTHGWVYSYNWTDSPQGALMDINYIAIGC